MAPFLDDRYLGSFDSSDTTVDMSSVEDSLAVPKTEPSREGSFTSSDSSPEPEPDEQTLLAGHAQVQKRKGGRKPVCDWQDASNLVYQLMRLRKDIRYVGGAQAEESSGSSRISRTSDRVHQAA